MPFNPLGEADGAAQWSRRIQEIMDEMLNRHFVHFRRTGEWQPATNVYESPQAYHVCMELAGVPSERIEMHCPTPTSLVICGLRAQPSPLGLSAAPSVHVLEIDEGPFRRQIDLPEPIRTDAIEATYDKGYLWIRLPKRTAR